MLEETEARIHDLKKEAFLFKRDVVVGGENARTNSIMSEKVEAYFADKMRLKDTEIIKLRLANQTFKRKMTKVLLHAILHYANPSCEYYCRSSSASVSEPHTNT